MYKLAQDLRFAFRQLYKTPGFTLTVIATLALGIGATTAIFSLVEGVLLRPLPFRDADRLVLLGDHLGGAGAWGSRPARLGHIRRRRRLFLRWARIPGAAYELSGSATPEVVQAARLTAGVFPTLGVEPALGRVFTAQEEDGHEPVAVISYPLWLNRYHRDPQVVGQHDRAGSQDVHDHRRDASGF